MRSAPQGAGGVGAPVGAGAHDGVYQTTDGGAHWTTLGDFPYGPANGRISLAQGYQLFGGPAQISEVVYAAVAHSRQAGDNFGNDSADQSKPAADHEPGKKIRERRRQLQITQGLAP